MTWNYRICKETYKGVDYEEITYLIKEVYYNKDGSIKAHGSAQVLGESIEEILQVLDRMKSALDKPVVDLDQLNFT